MKVEFLHVTPLHIVASAIRECYNSHDKSDTVQDNDNISCGPKDRELIDRVGNIKKHQSVLEHLVFSIRIQEVSRLLLQEFARHRISSLSVKSTRFTLQELKNEEPFIVDVFGKTVERAKKYIVLLPREMFKNEQEFNTFTNAQLMQLEFLREAIHFNVKRDVAKYLVPDSYKTNISWTINARSLQNFLKLRSDKHAHFEIRELANMIYKNMPEEYKYLFVDCMYKGV